MVEHLLQLARDEIRAAIARPGIDKISARYDTSDVLQESLIQVWHEIDEHELAKRMAATGWLSKVGRGHASKLRRFHLAQRRSVAKESRAASMHSSRRLDPALVAEVREQLQLLIKAVDDLDAKKRLIVYRRFVDGQSFSQMAEDFGRPPQWVRRRYQRAISQLRSYMADRGYYMDTLKQHQ